MLRFYHFHNWVHHIHQRNCRCDRLLCQCNFHRFDKGLRHIRQYLKKGQKEEAQSYDLLFITLKQIYPRLSADIYNKFKMKLYYYQFHSRFHNTHQRNCKCNRLLGQYSFHRFDKGLWHIHQYLKKIITLRIAKYVIDLLLVFNQYSQI